MASEEKTFRAYSGAQGDSYADGRPGYAPDLFRFIVDHHKSTGGQLDTVVDAGCGTGQATIDLSQYFATAIGLDPSAGMIQAARASLVSRSISSPVRYEVSAGETLGADLKPSIADNSVDLLTAATAAHWFDMSRFWPSAARIVKPGGTVALWARTAMQIDPTQTPNGQAIRAVMDEVSAELRVFSQEGSKITRDLYRDLPLPWTIPIPVKEFEEKSFFRKEWNAVREYIVSTEGEVDLGVAAALTLDDFAKLVATNSSVTRWRKANPEKAGTEEDLVVSMKRRIKRLLVEKGESPDQKVLRGGTAIVLLLFRKG